MKKGYSDWITNASLLIIELVAELLEAKVQIEKLKNKSNSYSSVTKNGTNHESNIETLHGITRSKGAVQNREQHHNIWRRIIKHNSNRFKNYTTKDKTRRIII